MSIFITCLRCNLHLITPESIPIHYNEHHPTKLDLMYAYYCKYCHIYNYVDHLYDNYICKNCETILTIYNYSSYIDINSESDEETVTIDDEESSNDTNNDISNENKSERE